MQTASKAGSERIALVIPALDEEDCIAGVVSGFAKLTRPKGGRLLEAVVVADNGSRDGTSERARSAGAAVVWEPKRGYGRACLTALAFLATRAEGPPDIVVFADGDGANEPEDLPALLEPIWSGRADLSIGARSRRAEPGSLTAPQRFGNALSAGLLRVLYGARTSDLGPFRAVRWTALQALSMEDENYGWTVEMQIKAAKLRLPVAEVDVRNYRRRTGESKVTGTVRGVVGAGTKILWTLFRYR